GLAAGAEERVAADLLATFDRLEQEARPELADAQVGADRRQEIAGQLADGGSGLEAHAEVDPGSSGNKKASTMGGRAGRHGQRKAADISPVGAPPPGRGAEVHHASVSDFAAVVSSRGRRRGPALTTTVSAILSWRACDWGSQIGNR